MNALLLILPFLSPPPERISPPEPDVELTDLWRFPCLDTARANYQFAEQHLDWLKAQRDFDRRNYWLWVDRIREAEQLRDVWWHLTIALDPSSNEAGEEYDWSAEHRLEYLRCLRDLIGPERYRMGLVGPAVPVWQFQEAR